MMKKTTYCKLIKYEQTLSSNAFRLNTQEVEAMLLNDDPALKNQQLDAGVKAAKIGIRKINLLDIKNDLKFDAHDDRPKNKAEIQKMVTFFKKYSIQAFKDMNTLLIRS
ncbi:hypothetical protein EV424DRAFT_1344167 [Suillus variegatus]|nr:hypothetical protein EV424DRAFT_1344167 [Suillus variegatus]